MSRALALSLESAFSVAEALDRLRLHALRALGRLARPVVRDRELRVALAGLTVVGLAAAAALFLPLYALALGPLVLGVPHLLADVRYLVVRPGHHRDRRLWLLVGLPLAAVSCGAGVVGGALAAGGAALVLGDGNRRRAFGVVGAGLFGLVVLLAGPVADVVFAHAHNFIAVALWWLWRERTSRLHLVPLGLFVALSIGIALVPFSSTFVGPLGIDPHLAALAPGVPEDLGIRLVVLFAFAQSVHYGVWLRLVPEEDRARATPRTFAASLRALLRDFGPLPLVLTAAVLAALVAFALVDLAGARDGYLRLASFHGSLELCALMALAVGGRRLFTGA